MAAKAAEEALADSGLKAEEIDLILVATSSSETVFPNTSCEVQKAIGAVHAWGIRSECSLFGIYSRIEYGAVLYPFGSC